MSSEPNAGWRNFYEDHWQTLGPETRTALFDLLPDGWSFEGKRVLDFGSGSGRTLRHFLDEAGSAEFWGVDIDPHSIAELESQYCPPLNAMVCDIAPPLGLEYGSFDVAWAISVFTHLTDHSIPWLLELHRLLKPRGYLIATFMGDHHSEFLAGEPWDSDRVGMNVLRHDYGWDHGGPMVMMSEWWVRAHWGRAFEILQIAMIHNQSWAVMRKRDVELTVEELESPADDQREYAALRHNLDQVRRELEQAKREMANQNASARREYERSLSWRCTRPLRAAAAKARSIRGRA